MHQKTILLNSHTALGRLGALIMATGSCSDGPHVKYQNFEDSSDV